MKSRTREKLRSYLKLLRLHRGERAGAYDEIASVYDDFTSVWDDGIATPALAQVNRLITERIKPGSVILDAGAGTGQRTLAILHHSRPAEVVALDASEGMLAVAQSKIRDPRVRFMQGDVRHLPFADEAFDAVISTWVIEIMADPRAVVQEFIRVIKQDGIVIYTFCSLPEGRTGDVLSYVLAKATSSEGPLTHLLSERERPFHRCAFSSIKQFAGGLTTVATVGKCCTVTNELIPCWSESV